MLTLAQALVIKTNSMKPPWRASQLASPSAKRPLSLTSLVNAVGQRRVVVFSRVRPIAPLLNLKTWTQITAAFSSPPPSTADFKTYLQAISKALPAGCSIVYVSTDGQTVGISGTINAFTKIKGKTLKLTDTQTKGWEDVAQGLGATSAGGIALAVSADGAIVFFAFLAFAFAFFMFDIGIQNLVEGYCPATSNNNPGDDDDDSLPEPPGPVVGEPPSSLSSGTSAALNDLELLLEYTQMADVPDPGALPGAGDLIPDSPSGISIPGADGDGDGADGDGGAAA
jgi:hypothetical protein